MSNPHKDLGYSLTRQEALILRKEREQLRANYWRHKMYKTLEDTAQKKGKEPEAA